MNQADLKIVIIGRNGQLAWEANQQFQGLGQIICVGRPEIDLLDIKGVREEIRRIKPSVLVNTAAYTAVDQAESEPEAAMKINSEAPAAMADEAKRLGAVFITYSTDYVFDGKSASPYKESRFCGAAQCVWSKQAQRRAGCGSRGRESSDLSNLMGVWRAWQEFLKDHSQAGNRKTRTENRR